MYDEMMNHQKIHYPLFHNLYACPTTKYLIKQTLKSLLVKHSVRLKKKLEMIFLKYSSKIKLLAKDPGNGLIIYTLLDVF